MNVQTRAPRDFTPAEIELAALISDLAAGALDRALLYDRMNRQLTELSTLARVSETVNSPLYLDEMLQVVVEMAAQVMNAPVCTLRLLDEDRDELVVRAAQSALDHYTRKPPLKRTEGVAGLVLRDRRPVAVADVRVDPRYPFREAAAREGLVSLLAVPLIVRERAIGVLSGYTAEPRVFSEKEIALFSTLANQTALAIENAQLATNAAVVREMHHRVRNNLQTVAMLLRLQFSQGSTRDAASAVQIAVNRIQSIAAVHEVLAHAGYRLVDVKDVAERLARLTTQGMLRPDLDLTVRVEGEPLVLPSRPATALALVINELLQNALEHAFIDRPRGAVDIIFSHAPDGGLVEVMDDGVGWPADPPPSLGLEIITALVRDDLRGQIEFLRRPPPASGTQVIVRVPAAGFSTFE